MERDRCDAWVSFMVLGFVCFFLAGLPLTAGADQPWTAGSSGLAATGENIGDPDLSPEVFGLDENMDFISAEEFECSDSANTCDWGKCDTSMYWCSDSTTSNVYAAVELPTGALITGMRVFYYDANAGLDMSVRLRRAYAENSTRGDIEIRSWMSSGSPGYDSVYVDVDPDVTVVRRYIAGYLVWGYQSYYLWATLPAGTFHRLRGVAIFWNRQVSPSPAVASFDDVPTNHWAFQYVEALAHSGITAGCGGDNYCPDANVSRAQMAVFLAKALGLHWNH